MDNAEVVTLLARQHWVATVGQLEAMGVSRFSIARARRQGVVTSLFRGVVAVVGVDLTFEGRALAVQLLAGPSSFVSGPSAGHLHGLRSMTTHRVEVTLHEAKRASVPAPHRLVRTSWFDPDRDVVTGPDGLRLASPLRTMFGLATQFNQHRFERAAEDMWHKGLVTPASAGEYLQAIRQSGKSGVKRMEDWLERTSFRDGPAQSGLELAFVDMIEQVGLPTPVRQHPLTLQSGEQIHLDLAWPDVRLAVEPGHSWWHGGDLRQRADQARDRACAVLGWHILRYDEVAARDRSATAQELLALYRRRAADVDRGF